MNYEELIESLWQEAEKKIETMIRETSEEESKIEKEAMLTLSRIRDDGQQHSSYESAKRIEEILAEAEKNSRMISIEANIRLAERLYSTSCASLPGLRQQRYREIFMSMTSELPMLPWKIVRVNPEDSGIAAEQFPNAEIIADERITGGMDATTGDGKVRVINTFEKRLERAWEDIIPDLLKKDYETV
jgi:V/A-type H+-transporting ATPase subunit E